MAIISKQIGWSQESNLIYEVLRQLNQLTNVTSSSSNCGDCPVSTDGTTITGNGTIANPLVAVPQCSDCPVAVDGVTITGNGTIANPLVAAVPPSEWTYTEVEINAATLASPPGLPSGATGVYLLPQLSTNDQYYDWRLCLEFIPGSAPFSIPFYLQNFSVSRPNANSYGLNYNQIPGNLPLVWQLDSGDVYPVIGPNTSFYPQVANYNDYVTLEWLSGLITGGNGKLKAKIWYKIINLG